MFANIEDEYNRNNVFRITGIVGRPADDTLAYNDPERWAVESLENLAGIINVSEFDENVFTPLCIEHGIYGVHYIDKIKNKFGGA